MKLTPVQRRFLESYLCEVSAEILDGDRQPFVEFFLKNDFDGSATVGEIRVAKNLHAAGYLKTCDDHGRGFINLYVAFNQQGADALWWVHNHPLRMVA